MFHSEQLILSAASSSSHFVLLGLLCPAAICPESAKNEKKDLFVKFADQNSPNYVTLCYFSQKLVCPSKKQAYQQTSHQLLLTLKQRHDKGINNLPLQQLSAQTVHLVQLLKREALHLLQDLAVHPSFPEQQKTNRVK